MRLGDDSKEVFFLIMRCFLLLPQACSFFLALFWSTRQALSHVETHAAKKRQAWRELLESRGRRRKRCLDGLA